MNLEILFDDDYLIAINKPPGILVHRTNISEDKVFILQLLRDQIGQRIYPVHRLDRGTSGVLVFGKSKESAALLAGQFREKKTQKTYLAIVRGFVKEKDTIDYPMAKEKGKPLQNAITSYKKLAQSELLFSVGKYPSSRYSFVEIQPETGRFHQIRKHFAHIRHPIINCKKHGDVKHNNYFRNELGISRMLLHASKLRLIHPIDNESIILKAPINLEFQNAMDLTRLS
jgi:tRNA pseudouridine65 synthase